MLRRASPPDCSVNILNSAEFDDSLSVNHLATSAVTAERKLASYWNSATEVSPFDARTELNYSALQNYGSNANSTADLDLFLKQIAPA
jgi:hypothetical protein